MESRLEALVAECVAVAEEPDAQSRVEAIVAAAVRDPAVAEAVATHDEWASLEDLAIHRSETLTMLAGSIPPGFSAAPHNHNIWSVVGVAGGREDNELFERADPGLEKVGEVSVVAPGVLANPADVIHAIHNRLDDPLLAVHAYGGDLFRTPRSTWDPDTHAEIPFDWGRVASADGD